MLDRKLDVSTGAGGAVADARTKFDDHLNGCADCQPGLCFAAEQLWRTVCLTALRQRHRQQMADALADTVTAAPVVQGHPSCADAAADADHEAAYPSTQEAGA